MSQAQTRIVDDRWQSDEAPEPIRTRDESTYLERLSAGATTRLRTHTCPLCGRPREEFEQSHGMPSFQVHLLESHEWSDLETAPAKPLTTSTRV